MPIPQSRIRDLLEEHERWIRALDAFREWFANVRNATTTEEEKFNMLESELAGLAMLPRTYAIVERRWLNANWKRNDRLRHKQTAKRRAAGMRALTGAQKPLPTQSALDREYEEFNAGLGAYEASAKDEQAYAKFNLEPSETLSESELCMRELQLKEPPSEALLETWRDSRNSATRLIPSSPFD